MIFQGWSMSWFQGYPLKAQIVSPEHNEGDDACEHAQARKKRHRGILIEKLSINRGTEQHEAHQDMDKHEQKRRNADCHSGVQPAGWHRHAKIFRWPETKIQHQ